MNNLITRDDLKKMIAAHPDKDIEWCIDHVRPAAAEPIIQGKWEPKEDGIYECNQCSAATRFPELMTRCYSCGAHMYDLLLKDPRKDIPLDEFVL